MREIKEENKKIENVIQQIFGYEKNYSIYDLKIFKVKEDYRIKLSIDNEKGITLDDCVKFTKLIKNQLSLEDEFREKFSIEVSSPGIRREIRDEKEYKRFIGNNVKVKYNDEAASKTVKGLLIDANKGKITLNIEGNKLQINIKDIKKANLEPIFKKQEKRNVKR